MIYTRCYRQRLPQLGTSLDPWVWNQSMMLLSALIDWKLLHSLGKRRSQNKWMANHQPEHHGHSSRTQYPSWIRHSGRWIGRSLWFRFSRLNIQTFPTHSLTSPKFNMARWVWTFGIWTFLIWPFVCRVLVYIHGHTSISSIGCSPSQIKVCCWCVLPSVAILGK